jgi:thiosulfate/3-mercaptopyruvate sulfurtransferase
MSVELPLILEPQELQKRLNDDNLLIIDLSSERTYRQGHVPGAIFVPPGAIVAGTPPAPGKLPSLERLQQLFSQLGLRPHTHVVAYDDEGGGWAGRFIWTLDMIGHYKYSYLNGGIWAWRRANCPVSTAINEPMPTPNPSLSLSINESASMTKDEIMAHLNDADFVVWDARTREEYAGIKVTAQKNGHIPGAIHCEWTELMDKDQDLRIRQDAEQYLAQKGLTTDKKIVTHCQTHHRSGFTYLVGKMLGFKIRAYPGSWSEWGNSPDTSVET